MKALTVEEQVRLEAWRKRRRELMRDSRTLLRQAERIVGRLVSEEYRTPSSRDAGDVRRTLRAGKFCTAADMAEIALVLVKSMEARLAQDTGVRL